MAWSQGQNPTGVRNPAVSPIVVDPLAAGTSNEETREVRRRRTRHTVPASIRDLPIAANARKADGFAPNATSGVQ